jgi:ribonuclease P protein component
MPAGPARLPRLTRRAEFLAVAREGRKLGRGPLLVQALPRIEPVLRLGFTATKKLGNAVVRNRAKRRMREAARLEFTSSPAPGWDVVLVAREGIGETPFPALRETLSTALQRLGVRP